MKAGFHQALDGTKIDAHVLLLALLESTSTSALSEHAWVLILCFTLNKIHLSFGDLLSLPASRVCFPLSFIREPVKGQWQWTDWGWLCGHLRDDVWEVLGLSCQPPPAGVSPWRMISLLCSRMFWNNKRVNCDTSENERQARFWGLLPARGTDQLAWLLHERCYLSCQFSCQASHL